MKDFAAIDFETANNERSSVCSVGIVIVRNGEIVDSFYSLIQPEPNYYNYWCSQVHGLCHQDTDVAPVFPDVWKHIEPLIEGLPLVAHNKPFDEGCLKAVFRVYQMDYPDYEFYDTLCVSRRVLPDLDGEYSQIWRTTSFRQWPLPVVMSWKTITTHLPTLKHVHGLQEKYYKKEKIHHYGRK